jgi:hypothetical protein
MTKELSADDILALVNRCQETVTQAHLIQTEYKAIVRDALRGIKRALDHDDIPHARYIVTTVLETLTVKPQRTH